MRYTSLGGTCRNGAQRDRGRLIHAVPDIDGHPTMFGPALCGAKPGRTSYGWIDGSDPAPTCPRCLAKLERVSNTSA